MNNESTEFPSFFLSILISTALHVLLLSIALSIVDTTFDHSKKKNAVNRADEDRNLSIVIASEDAGTWQADSKHYSGRRHARGETGPYGLNDDAGRELVECARSGISVTPENFLEYGKIREMRKGLAVKPKNDLFRKYPILTGTGSFEFGSGHKLKSDYRECHEEVRRIINLPTNKKTSPDDDADDFNASVAGYLIGERPVRTWRTLWMVRKPPTKKDKVELVRLLRRLQNYHVEGDDAGYEHMRTCLGSIIRIIPDELIYPAPRTK